jgi:beta-phosphoglucomutase-like phosphatase (HAD superfamily)
LSRAMTTYGVIFDCDGVLADTESVICQASIDMFRELYSVEMQPEDFTPFIGTGAIRYTEGPAEKYGLKIDIDKAVAVREEMFLALLDGGRDIGFPGAPDLVETLLNDPAWRVGLATSSGLRKSRVSLDAAKIPHARFDGYICGDDVAKKKPAPDIFLAAAESIDISPKFCVGIEDSVQGVASVKLAGMVCVAVTNSFDESELDGADMVVTSLAELNPTVLRNLVADT